jgi:hypothetical protein
MPTYCTQCGTSSSDDAYFCLTCGKRLKGGSSSPPPSEAGASSPNEVDGRSTSVQKKLPSPSPREDNPTESDQIIDESEYRALMQQVQGLRTYLQSLSCPADVDPWRFFMVFDRVHLKPGYVPNFLFTPRHYTFGPNGWSELSGGVFTLRTRRALWPPLWWWPVNQVVAHFLPHKAPKGRVISAPGWSGSSALPSRLQQGLKGLVFERSVSGFLQFAVFCLEAERWARQRIADWPEDANWQWVCSREWLEACVPALGHSSPPAPSRAPFALTVEDWQWLRSVDPQLHVCMRGTQVEVGGLAHSPWDGYGWLECELSWPNRFRIKRREKLGIAGSQRPIY